MRRTQNNQFLCRRSGNLKYSNLASQATRFRPPEIIPLDPQRKSAEAAKLSLC